MLRLVLLICGVILASIIPIINGIEPLERAPATSPRLENLFGETVSKNILINQPVQITADITNNQEISQKFVYIVQIKDSQNIIYYVNWFANITLEPHQMFSASRSWTPEFAGKYVAEIYVWDSFSNQDALSESIFINITAS